MYFKALDNTLHFLTAEDMFNGGEKMLPAGSVAITELEAQGLIAAQNKPTEKYLEAQFMASIQQRLDYFARERNYDGILSACTYVSSTVPKFKSEGQACVNLRDATWAAAYDILAKVQSGQRPMPTSIADIEADLPAAVWPA